MPSESHSITKIAIFVGMAFVLIAAFNPSAGAAWANFQASIQGFPTFNNPFNQATNTLLSYNFLPIQPSNSPGSMSSNFTGCFGSESWTCVQDLNGTDSEKSFVTLPNPAVNTSNAMWVDLSPSVKGRTISVQYDFWCRYVGPTNIGAYLIPTIWKWNGAANVLIEGDTFEVSACGTGFFSHVTATSDTCNRGAGGACGEADSNLYNTPFSLQVAAQSPFTSTPWKIDLSTVRISLLIGVVNADTTVTCGGDVLSGISCHLKQLIDFVSKLGTFAVNAVVYVFQILGYLVNLVVQFFSLFGYFFSVPGMPSILQGFLTVLFVGLMLFVALVIMGKVRGTGNTG